MVRVTLAMGRDFGFPVIHFLQPFNSASGKPQGEWEKRLRRDAMQAECAAAIERRMAADSGATGFVSLLGVFDADSTTAFVDEHSHLTEAANQQVARRIVDHLTPTLQRP
jgi:hypothetical protein